MGIGTFGSFTQARLAIYAAQTGLTVTGNNISNVNTKGYTRQRLDQKSLYNAGSDRYYSTTGVKVGQGVLCYGLSQLRDPYLDIQYRTKSADVGAMDGLLNGLEGIQQILDEVGKGGEIAEGKEFGIVAAQFREIFKALNGLTAETGHDEFDVQVRSACQKLVSMLNSYSKSLEEHYDNTVMRFEQNVSTVNTILTNIQALNENIRQADLYGDDALEMRDERNLLIDELSEYIKIDVQYSTEKIGVGAEVEKLTIRMDNANPDSAVHTDETVLIDGIYASQLSIGKVLNEQAYKYIEPDGTLTNNAARAQTPFMNAWGEYIKVNEDGSHTVVDDPKDATLNPPTKNPKYDDTGANEGLLYLKSDGTPTSSYQEAAYDPNFDITVSELTDRNGRVLYTLTPPVREEITEDLYPADGKATAEVDEATGVITITTYFKELSSEISRNPDWIKGSTTAYEYLTADGLGTHDPNKADRVYRYNPNYGKKQGDEGYDDTKPDGTFRFYTHDLDADGKFIGTNESKDAWDPKENPKFKKDDPTGYRYIKTDDDGKPTDPPVYTTELEEARGKPLYYKQVYEKVPSTAVKLDDNDLYGKLQSQRELLTESGEFASQNTIAKVDENAATKRGIPYYQKSLDLLAHTFAAEFNKTNQGCLVNPEGEYLDPAKTDGSTLPPLTNGTDTYVLNKNHLWDKPAVTDPKDENTYVPDWVKEKLEAEGYDSVSGYVSGVKADGTRETPRGIFVGGNLFSNSGDTNNADDPPITASNISISMDWAAGPMMVGSFVCPTGTSTPASSDSDNILKNFVALGYKQLAFRPDTVPYEGVEGVRHEAMFNGKLEDMWLNMGTVLGNDIRVTTTKLDNAYDSQVSLDTSRDSVSAVDFNDEAMNLMMYAKAYNAACRMMTTLDSVLDKLINNTGMTT